MSSDRPPNPEGQDNAEFGAGTGDGLNPEQRIEWRRLYVQGERTALIWRLALVLVTSISLLGVFWLLSSDTSRIADVGYARGLITVLFSVGVVTMALIIVLTLLLQKRDENKADAEGSEKRFQRTKEILTLLLGILGTVVGFYFGTTSEPHTLATVVDVVASDEAPAPGAEVTLTVLITGGDAPFTYRIAFEGLEVEEIQGTTGEPWIREVVSIPEDIGESKELKATVEITDASGNESKLTRTFSLSLLPDAANEDDEDDVAVDHEGPKQPINQKPNFDEEGAGDPPAPPPVLEEVKKAPSANEFFKSPNVDSTE